MGKGDKRRPSAVSVSEYQKNWEQTFKNDRRAPPGTAYFRPIEDPVFDVQFTDALVLGAGGSATWDLRKNDP